MWNIWEHIWCVAHSSFFVGLKKSLLFSLVTCIFRKQSVRVNISCTKRIFNLSAEVFIKVRNARLCARCAIFFLKIKQIPFSCRLAKGFTFLTRVQNQFKMVLEMCIFQASIVLTERNAILLTVMYQLRDSFLVVEKVEPYCLFTKFLSRCRRTWRRQKQTKHVFPLLEKDELVTRQTIVPYCCISLNQV